jgi:hypothetical protein
MKEYSLYTLSFHQCNKSAVKRTPPKYSNHTRACRSWRKAVEINYNEKSDNEIYFCVYVFVTAGVRCVRAPIHLDTCPTVFAFEKRDSVWRNRNADALQIQIELHMTKYQLFIKHSSMRHTIGSTLPPENEYVSQLQLRIRRTLQYDNKRDNISFGTAVYDDDGNRLDRRVSSTATSEQHDRLPYSKGD